MLCSLCKKRPGVVFFEQAASKPEERRKICLCEVCALSRGFINAAQVPDPTKIVQLIEDIDATDSKRNPDIKRLCPVCKRSLYKIRKTHYVGCAYCYTAFAHEIAQIVSSIYPMEDWRKKQIEALSPEFPYNQKPNLILEVEKLEKKLSKAVDKEDYEAAATLRDEINKLKEKLDPEDR